MLVLAFAGQFGQTPVVLVEIRQLFFRPVLQVDEPVTSALQRGNEFVQLQLNRLGFFVLGPLNEEDHQERDDGRTGIDDQLPRVRKMERRPGHQPNGNNGDSSCKSPTAPGIPRRLSS